jgi:NAD(P)-dependent dehydrogenase (short-subunit alcohol dehydrogenase family)
MKKAITGIQDAFSLKGQNAIITGGNRGLGFGVALPWPRAGPT